MMDETQNAPLSVFITGAQTGVGRETARLLVAAGHQVTGSVTSTAEAAELRKTGAVPAYPDLTRAGEIRSALIGAQANILIHLAPQIPNEIPVLDPVWKDFFPLLDAGSAAIAEAAEAANIEFIVASSYVFADAKGTSPLFKLARQAEQTILNGAVPACVLRAGYQHGASSDATLEFRDALMESGALSIGDGHTRAHWIASEDFARAVIAAVEKRPAGVTLNIVDDQPATVAEYATYFAESLGLTAPSGSSPLGFLRDLWVKDKTHEELLSTAVSADSSAAQTALDWKPNYPTYRDGINNALLALRAGELVS